MTTLKDVNAWIALQKDLINKTTNKDFVNILQLGAKAELPMTDQFFKKPILNSPYEYPSSHWELVEGLPTQKIISSRRKPNSLRQYPNLKNKNQLQQIFLMKALDWVMVARNTTPSRLSTSYANM